jgi:hypothetical protein
MVINAALIITDVDRIGALVFRHGSAELLPELYSSEIALPLHNTRFGEFLYIDSDDPKERQEEHVGNVVFAGEHLSDALYGHMNGAALFEKNAGRN